jgi:hypothetical protein
MTRKIEEDVYDIEEAVEYYLQEDVHDLGRSSIFSRGRTHMTLRK